MSIEAKLYRRIANKTALVGVIGVGYVGKALVNSATRQGFKVIGFSRSELKAKRMENSRKLNFTATSDFSKLSQCSIICTCVPTPIHPDKSPDLQPLIDAIRYIKKYMKKGTLVIIESTVAPGTTRKIVLPLLKSKFMVVGEDFFLAFSPERVDPGNKKYRFSNTPKVVGGINQSSLKLAVAFYEKFVTNVTPVSSTEAAEMTKILENTFRLINISFINQLKEYTDAIGVDIWEVINAAATKPFGFMPHYPGPGVGGHCIPVDPYYLLEDANKRKINLSMVREAGLINDKQVLKVVTKTQKILSNLKLKNKIGKILLVGVTYKPDVADVRESPVIKIMQMFKNLGHQVDYHDPYISSINGFESKMLSQDIVSGYDIIVIGTNHKKLDYVSLQLLKKPILDTRNTFKNVDNSVIFRL